MRRRDLGILLLSAVALLLSVRQDGGLLLQPSWFLALHEAQVVGGRQRMPPPFVADLDGDGSPEVIVATRDASVVVVDPLGARARLAAGGGRGDAGVGIGGVGGGGGGFGGTFAPGSVVARASLLPARLRVATGRRPVALAAGHLEPLRRRAEGSTAASRRTRVVVVVTEGWHVVCLDHNLKVVWETNLRADWPEGAHFREVAVMVNSHAMHHGDRGVVIVGASMGVAPPAAEGEDEGEEDGEDADAIGHAERWMRAHRNSGRQERAAAAAGRRMFAYYALAGQSGELRWKHESGDFRREHELAKEETVPQHDYKLDANSILASHRWDEVECRMYRESVLDAMPHRWETPHDTALRLAHFARHRARAAKARPQVAAGAVAGAVPATGGHRGKSVSGGNSVAAALGHLLWASTRAGSRGGGAGGVRVAVAARDDHELPAGGARRGSKLQDGAAGGGGGSGGASDHGAGHAHGSLRPNAIVAHLEEGVEVINMYTGSTLCKLHLPPRAAHADVNADGVLDHVFAWGGDVHAVVAEGRARPACWAYALAGVPPREQTWNGSVCGHRQSWVGTVAAGGDPQVTRLSRLAARSASGVVAVATPALLPRMRSVHHGRHPMDAIFFNSLGEVSSFSPAGTRQWLVSTGCAWLADRPGSNFRPTLAVFSLERGGPPEALLVAGTTAAAVLSPTGERLVSIELPHAPVEALVLADFSGDGLNDVIAVTDAGVYAWLQVRRPGAVLFTALLGGMAVAIALVMLTQQLSAPSGRPVRRSTD